MPKIPNFGFSAFLKIISSNEKPQKWLIRERHKPSENGYDYHKSLRARIQRIAFHALPEAEALDSVTEITQIPERESTRKGLKRFFEWRAANSALLEPCNPITFQSPQGLFKITFQPDFLAEIHGRRTAVHVWNTGSDLSGNIVLAALSMVANRYPSGITRPDDFAVLSLQDGSLYRWSDASREHAALGEKILSHVEQLCRLSRMELGLPTVLERDSPSHPSRP